MRVWLALACGLGACGPSGSSVVPEGYPVLGVRGATLEWTERSAGDEFARTVEGQVTCQVIDLVDGGAYRTQVLIGGSEEAAIWLFLHEEPPPDARIWLYAAEGGVAELQAWWSDDAEITVDGSEAGFSWGSFAGEVCDVTREGQRVDCVGIVDGRFTARLDDTACP